MHTSPYFFANKFHLHEDRLALHCLEQRLFNTTRDLQLGKVKVDTQMYQDSVLVNNRLKVEYIGLKDHPYSDLTIDQEFRKNKNFKS